MATTHYTVKSIHAPSVSVEPISDGFDHGGYAQAHDGQAFLDSFRDNGSTTLSQLIRKYEKTYYPVTCVVYDSFLQWALDVAAGHGLLAASFFTNSVAVCAIFSYIHTGQLALPADVEGNKPLVLPGLPPLDACDVPSFIRAPGSYPAYLDGRIEGERGYGASLWKPLSDQCTAWLEAKPRKSVIYISFGSMVSLTSKQIEEIAWALIAAAAYFLWVVRETAREAYAGIGC